MRNLIKTLSIVFIISALPFYTMAQKKHYSVVDTTIIRSMENGNEKFDIEYFEKNKKRDKVTIIKEDQTEIKLTLSGYGYYVEEVKPPSPKLYSIYREYYLNGNLKKEGVLLPGDLPVSIWRTYDE